MPAKAVNIAGGEANGKKRENCKKVLNGPGGESGARGRELH